MGCFVDKFCILCFSGKLVVSACWLHAYTNRSYWYITHLRRDLIQWIWHSIRRIFSDICLLPVLSKRHTNNNCRNNSNNYRNNSKNSSSFSNNSNNISRHRTSSRDQSMAMSVIFGVQQAVSSATIAVGNMLKNRKVGIKSHGSVRNRELKIWLSIFAKWSYIIKQNKCFVFE